MAARKSTQLMGKTDGGKYRTFLLRCWQEEGVEKSGEATWRFTLVQIGDGEAGQKGFACLDNLVDYLRQELGEKE